MENFGFNQVFIKTLDALYNRTSAQLKINGKLTDSFLSQRSTRQGCPLSQLLFAIFTELPTQWIRHNNMIKGIKTAAEEQKLSLFAYDILVYLPSPTGLLPALISVLDKYNNKNKNKNNNTFYLYSAFQDTQRHFTFIKRS